jgi:hypothetical protein
MSGPHSRALLRVGDIAAQALRFSHSRISLFRRRPAVAADGFRSEPTRHAAEARFRFFDGVRDLDMT